ncbi:MAG: protocatechuate 3,4-dioxygenase [Gammaproteobacteria bacterium]|nr:protocatechuate 3,4-dioxygenase [Gammaproteobacteria bacterium]
MVWKKHEYDKLPGTYVFDGRLAAMGYPLNKMCMTFNDEPNRQEFLRDEDAYCRKFGLSAEQTAAVKARDWLQMLRVGGNVYYLAKLATFSGKNMQDIGAQMQNIPVEEFKAKLVAAGK